MNMKQRHHAQGNIVGREVVCFGHVAARDRHILVHQRHALGASRASAGVQHQRDIVACGHGNRNAFGSIHNAHIALRVHIHGIHRDIQLLGGAPCVFRAFRRRQQDLGRRVFQVEAEFVVPIGRVQRRGGPGHGSGQKRDDRRQAVGQHIGHAVASPDAHSGQRFSHFFYLAAQGIIGYGGPGLRNNDGGGIPWCGVQQRRKVIHRAWLRDKGVFCLRSSFGRQVYTR